MARARFVSASRYAAEQYGDDDGPGPALAPQFAHPHLGHESKYAPIITRQRKEPIHESDPRLRVRWSGGPEGRGDSHAPAGAQPGAGAQPRGRHQSGGHLPAEQHRQPRAQAALHAGRGCGRRHRIGGLRRDRGEEGRSRLRGRHRDGRLRRVRGVRAGAGAPAGRRRHVRAGRGHERALRHRVPRALQPRARRGGRDGAGPRSERRGRDRRGAAGAGARPHRHRHREHREGAAPGRGAGRAPRARPHARRAISRSASS